MAVKESITEIMTNNLEAIKRQQRNDMIEKEIEDMAWEEFQKVTTVGEGGFQDFLDGFKAGLKKLEPQLEAEKKLNEEIKVRFVKCNTCTDEMKSKCLMFSENLCEGDRCEELVDLMELINKSDLQKENARLKLELEALNGQIPWKDIKDKSEVIGQLTKAKDLLDKVLRVVHSELHPYQMQPYLEVLKQAEQFLNSEVKNDCR